MARAAKSWPFQHFSRAGATQTESELVLTGLPYGVPVRRHRWEAKHQAPTYVSRYGQYNIDYGLWPMAHNYLYDYWLN